MDQYSKEMEFYEKQQQRQIDNDPNSIYADSLREDKVANLIYQISPDNLLGEIEHRIRGEKKDPYTEQWIPISKISKPISEELIGNFISFLGSILNQNTTLSNFSSNEINNIMGMIIAYIEDDLESNAKLYKIEGNYTEMTRIGMIICNSCFAVFKRALNGQESRRIFSALRVSENLSQSGQKKGIAEALKFWS